MMPALDDQDISGRTIGHYDAHALAYWSGTHDHDVTQNVAALLHALDGAPPFIILDFGCGPGRDLCAFTALGHVAIGLDGSPRFVAMARELSSCEVWQQDFLDLDLPATHFDGIFANATLFHVPSRRLPRVLRELHATLKHDGVLFASNPRGNNQEGWNGDRYGAFHDLEQWRRYVLAAGFIELRHYYRPPDRQPVEQTWLASLWRKVPDPERVNAQHRRDAATTA